MKKFAKPLMFLGALSVLFTQSGCYGSFSLTKKYYDWNGSISDSKFVVSLIFWASCIIPVYLFTVAADVVVLNLIEFWSGSNPISMKEGDYEQQIVERGGIHYKMEATRNRLSVTPLEGKDAGKITAFVYSSEKSTWSIEKDGKLTTVAKVNVSDEGNSVTYFTATGSNIHMPLPSNENELAAFKAAHQLNFATR